jgi:Bacterial membrane protein YfhO
VVVLAVSFDPGWSATVDGRPAATEMVAPALVAVTAPPGVHHITFHYTGFGAYPELLALAALDLLAATTAGCLSRRHHAATTPIAGLPRLRSGGSSVSEQAAGSGRADPQQVLLGEELVQAGLVDAADERRFLLTVPDHLARVNAEVMV